MKEATNVRIDPGERRMIRMTCPENGVMSKTLRILIALVCRRIKEERVRPGDVEGYWRVIREIETASTGGNNTQPAESPDARGLGPNSTVP